ncbi:hypothetical protein BC941DRAFT_508788 [Chlamydoabsidia padenii]|nr:hypothetical protein BC941DRAFT_508788 [Chlamydoabsidia padenii]
MIESCDHEDDIIDHVIETSCNDSKDHSDEDEDDLESTCSSVSFEPSIPDEDINFDLVYALHSFAAVVTGQASVIKGDALILMDDSNSYWWLVEVLKTRELGYIPAENTETPFERLARLNKHRNVDITAPTTDDLMDPAPSTKQPKHVTLGPEDEYQTLVFEKDDDGDDDVTEDLNDHDYYQDYDYEKDDYGHDTNQQNDTTNLCVVLDSEPVDQLTATLGNNTTSIDPIKDDYGDSDEDDTFEDARQDFDHETMPKNETLLEDTTLDTPLSAPQDQQEMDDTKGPSDNLIPTIDQQQEFNSGKLTTTTTTNVEDRTTRTEPLRVFGGNITQGLLFHTFDITLSTTAHELLTMATDRFNLDNGFESIEYYLSVQGLDGDDYILLAQDKPLPIFRTLTASLTTPMPRSSMEQQQQIAKAKERLVTNDTSNNRRRSTSFSNYEQTYHDEDSLIRFYLHQRIKRGRAGLLYIKVCLCRGGVGQKRNSKHFKNKDQGRTIDRMEKIMAVQVDSQIGMVINEALAKFNVPDATAENFLGGLGDVRSFTKYRMSVRTNNDIEMPLQATQDMATLLNLLQIKWNVGERTLLTNDLLFMLFPSGGIKKGQQHKGSRDHSHQDYYQQYPQQERRPSILDILMDSPCTNEVLPSQQQQDQGQVGVDSPITDPLILQQKISPEINWSPHSPSSILNHNQHRRSSLYSTISDSSIPDSLTDDMTFGFNNDKKSTSATPKSNSFRQHFKRWVGWGPKKTQQQQQQYQQQHQQQHLSPTSAINHHPLMVSSSNETSSSCTLAPLGGETLQNSSVISVSRSVLSQDQGARRSSNCTTESSSSSNLSSMGPTKESASSNNATLAGHSELLITNDTRASVATSNNTSLPPSTSNHSVTVPMEPSASIHSGTTGTMTATQPTEPGFSMTLPSTSWNRDTEQRQMDSLLESDISSLSNSSSDMDSTIDGPADACGGNGDNNQLVYEWLSDSDNEDSDAEGSQQQQQQQSSSIGLNQETDDIMTQYSTWMKRASLDATSTMNQHINTTTNTASRSSVSLSIVSASFSSSSSLQLADKDVSSSSYIDCAPNPSQHTGSVYSDDSKCNHSTSNDQENEPTYFSSHQDSQTAAITPPSSSFLPSTSLDIDALLLVTHGVDFLKNRESSNWEDDDAHYGQEGEKDRYAFHPWTQHSDKSSDASSTINIESTPPPPPPPLSLSTTTSTTVISHGKKPSTVTPSPTSSTATIIVPGPKIASLHQDNKKLGEKEGMDDELHRIVSMHVLF